MADRLSVSGTEWEQLQHAAELTIAAAAAAVVWAGEDDYGVLARVSAADPIRMVSSRLSTQALADVPMDAADTAAAERTLAEADGFVVAALPASRAPQWAATVIAAFRSASQRCQIAEREGGRQREVSRQALMMWALGTIRQWGCEPLRPEAIEVAAHHTQVLVSLMAWVPAAPETGS